MVQTDFKQAYRPWQMPGSSQASFGPFFAGTGLGAIAPHCMTCLASMVCPKKSAQKASAPWPCPRASQLHNTQAAVPCCKCACCTCPNMLAYAGKHTKTHTCAHACAHSHVLVHAHTHIQCGFKEQATWAGNSPRP